MSQYKVPIKRTKYHDFYVEADNKAEAIKKAEVEFCDRTGIPADTAESLILQKGEDGKWFFPE